MITYLLRLVSWWREVRELRRLRPMLMSENWLHENRYQSGHEDGRVRS